MKRQEETIYELMFPNNINADWNTMVEQTGWPDDAKSTNLSFLQRFVSSANMVASEKDFETFCTGPIENGENVYVEALKDYPHLKHNSIPEIEHIIGKFSEMKAIFDTDVGHDVNTWRALCSDSNYFRTLSSEDPHNISYKLVEFILWYFG